MKIILIGGIKAGTYIDVEEGTPEVYIPIPIMSVSPFAPKIGCPLAIETYIWGKFYFAPGKPVHFYRLASIPIAGVPKILFEAYSISMGIREISCE